MNTNSTTSRARSRLTAPPPPPGRWPPTATGHPARGTGSAPRRCTARRPTPARRVVNVHALVATGVNADGHREILGLQVTSAEDGAGWLAFFRDLTARGLTGVALVTSDAHRGLVDAIGATLPGAAWQRCRTHWACQESSCSFPGAGSTICYARRRRGPRSARDQVRGAAAASERAAAADGAGLRGSAAGTRGRGRGRGCGPGQPHHGAPRRGRAGRRRGAAAGRASEASRRRT